MDWDKEWVFHYGHFAGSAEILSEETQRWMCNDSSLNFTAGNKDLSIDLRIGVYSNLLKGGGGGECSQSNVDNFVISFF